MATATFIEHTLPVADVFPLGQSAPDRFLELDVVQCDSASSCTFDVLYTGYSITSDANGYVILWSKTNGDPWLNVYSMLAQNCPMPQHPDYELGCVASTPAYFEDTPMPEPSVLLGLALGAVLLFALRRW